MKLPPRVEPEEGQGFGVYAKYFGQSLAYLMITAVTGRDPEAEEDDQNYRSDEVTTQVDEYRASLGLPPSHAGNSVSQRSEDGN